MYGAFSLLADWVLMAVLPGAELTGTTNAHRRPYLLSLLGVAVFATGGFVDLLWHEAFGVEAGIDALLSPAHLVLLAGGLLLLSTSFRTGRSARGEVGSVLPWPAVLSLTAVAALSGFFLSYVSAFGGPGAAVPLTRIPEGVPGHRVAELPAVAGLGAYLVTTGLLAVAYLHGRRVGAFPRGGLTSLVAGVAVSGAVLTQSEYLWSVVIAVLGAAAADCAVGSRSVRVVATTFPAFLWAGLLTGLAVTGDLGWPPVMWGGVIVLSVLVGAAVSSLVDPAARVGEQSSPDGPAVEVEPAGHAAR